MFKKYVEKIRKEGFTKEIIENIVTDHKEKRAEMLAMYGRYKQTKTDTPIFKREFIDGGVKINHKLANDWFGEVVDTKTGYMFGSPIILQLEKQAPQYQLTLEKMEKFRKINALDDLNSEVGKFSAIAGYDAMLAYIDKDGQERVMRVDGSGVCIITNGEITEPEFALHYYEKWDGGWRVDCYTDLWKTSFEGENITATDLAEVDAKQNLFDYCPLWGVPNNAELMGDADKALTEIDAYDRAISDMNSEIEQFRMAYMIFLGYEPEAEDLEKMRKNGAMYIPDVENGEDIKFLTKQMQHEFIDSHLNRLEANITRFAKHVNFTDEAFGGNVSGVAMRYKLFALETKAKTMERKHEAAMLYMFKVIASAWIKKGIKLDYSHIDVKYTRNIPVNIVDEANAAVALMAVTSRRTALEQLSFVNDVEAEIDRIEEEKMGSVDLDNPELLNDTKTEEPTQLGG